MTDVLLGAARMSKAFSCIGCLALMGSAFLTCPVSANPIIDLYKEQEADKKEQEAEKKELLDKCISNYKRAEYQGVAAPSLVVGMIGSGRFISKGKDYFHIISNGDDKCSYDSESPAFSVNEQKEIGPINTGEKCFRPDGSWYMCNAPWLVVYVVEGNEIVRYDNKGGSATRKVIAVKRNWLDMLLNR